jgi:hypothetical protein
VEDEGASWEADYRDDARQWQAWYKSHSPSPSEEPDWAVEDETWAWEADRDGSTQWQAWYESVYGTQAHRRLEEMYVSPEMLLRIERAGTGYEI